MEPASEFAFDFKSIVNPRVSGTGSITITRDNDKISAQAVLKYGTASPYKPGEEKAFTLSGFVEARKVIIGTEIADIEQQLMISVIFTDMFPTVYYSSIMPLDCGIIKQRGPIAKWRAAFGVRTWDKHKKE